MFQNPVSKTPSRLPTNPYRVGNPVYGDTSFFGRRDVLEWVEQSLHVPGNSALVLFGQPRIGKTSILLQLKNSLNPGSFHPVYFELRGKARTPLSSLLAELADAMDESCKSAVLDQRMDRDGIDWFRQRYLPGFLERVGREKRVVFLLDEFDTVSYSERQDLAENAAALTFLPFLYPLFDDPRLAFVLVLADRDLPQDVQAAFKASLSKEIWVLDFNDARDLVLTAERQNTLTFESGAVEHILELTSGHPYLTQLLCYSIWERLHSESSSPSPVVRDTDVDGAITAALELGELGIAWLWSGLLPAERICCAAIAPGAHLSPSKSERGIERTLISHAPRLRSVNVAKTCAELVKKRVLLCKEAPVDDTKASRGSERRYWFTVRMLQLWVARCKPLDTVKGELDLVDPRADVEFQNAKALIDREEWDGAIEHLGLALGSNPEHFGATLALGQIHQRLGDLDRAISELEKAYGMDPYEARDDLCAVLRVKAERFDDPTGMQDQILREAAAVYRRLTELQPDERRWQSELGRVQSEATLAERFTTGLRASEAGRWSDAQRALSYVVYHRPTYRREDITAAKLLADAVTASPENTQPPDRVVSSPEREVAYELTARQYGFGHSTSIAQCSIHRDGSGTFRREITLEAYSIVTELNYYSKLPESRQGSDLDFDGVRSLDSARSFVPEVVGDTKDSVEIRNRIQPPLLPGQSLVYEGVDSFTGLYAMPGDDLSSRLMPFDYYARDIMVPTRKLIIEVVFPYEIEPINPSPSVWYAVGMSMVPHPSEERRTKELLRKRRVGEQYVLTLEVELPVLGLTYVISWRPDQLIDRGSQNAAEE